MPPKQLPLLLFAGDPRFLTLHLMEGGKKKDQGLGETDPGMSVSTPLNTGWNETVCLAENTSSSSDKLQSA